MSRTPPAFKALTRLNASLGLDRRRKAHHRLAEGS
jgi:hypothetical protein